MFNKANLFCHIFFTILFCFIVAYPLHIARASVPLYIKRRLSCVCHIFVHKYVDIHRYIIIVVWNYYK